MLHIYRRRVAGRSLSQFVNFGSLRHAILVPASAILLAACGGDGGSSTASEDPTDPSDDTITVSIGNGLGQNFVAGEIGIQNPMLSAGGSTQLQVNLVNRENNNSAVTDPFTVTFSSNCIADGLSTIDGDTNTITGGLTVTYVSNGCSGEDTITATTTTLLGNTIEASGTVTIEADTVLSVQFIEATPTQLSLRGVGGTETAQVRFQLVGQQSAPIVGESITFSLNTSVGGLNLAETSAVSNNQGEVTAIVQSGTAPATAIVTATHDATGVSGSSNGINVSTGVPQANRLSLSRSFGNPRAFNFDGTEVDFNIIASDQVGNPVPNGTVISFASPEGGSIPSSCTTDGGRCSVTWVSSDPRPADGRATVIAFTSGAEEFDDVNGDAIFDDGDNFTPEMDLDEPFVDENENGIYDAGEFFFDFNNNGSIDLADGGWNGPLCEHSSLCGVTDEVGISETSVLAMSTDGVMVAAEGDFPAVGGTINALAGETVILGGMVLSDLNGNSMANGTTVSFESSVGTLQGTTSFEIGDAVNANGPFGIVLSTPDDPDTGILTLRIEVPDVVPQEFIWSISTSCSAPTAPQANNETQTSAVLSWTENGTASNWQVEWGPTGFVQGTGTMVAATNPFLLNGLTANTTYDYYVRSTCGGTNSASAGPVTFTTLP